MSIGLVTGLLFVLISIENAALSSARLDTLYLSLGSQLLVISRNPSAGVTVACNVYNKGSDEYDINMAEAGSFLVTASEKLMEDLVRNCNEFNYYGLAGIEERGGKRQYVIFPGTKWCGTGSRAKNDSDLGEYVETDRCCRAHDKCDIFIRSFEAKYDLFNYALYTIIGCDCDEKFRDCLVAAAKAPTTTKKDKSTANYVGNLFFNVIHSKCLQLDYPLLCIKLGVLKSGIVVCPNVRERSGDGAALLQSSCFIWWGKCEEYKPDTTKPKVWKFKDNYLRYPS